MANSNPLTTKAASVAPEQLSCLGPPPLLDGESSADYADLLARVSAAVEPADILEQIFVRDVVDLTWEELRLRRLKAALLECSQHKGIRELGKPLFGFRYNDELPMGGKSANRKSFDGLKRRSVRPALRGSTCWPKLCRQSSTTSSALIA